MTDREALYCSIICNPHEDLPRQVYADDFCDPERAEFIRCQIELAKLNGMSFADWYFQDGVSYQYSRGFVSSLVISWAAWQQHAPNLVWWPKRRCERCVEGWIDNGPKTGPKGPGIEKRWVQEPRSRTRCSACHGTGEIPGATMECPEIIEVHTHCSTCSGSGRIPTPFESVAATVQPITEVTLTTWPLQRGGDDERPSEILAGLRERWPSIEKWNLPQ